MSAPSPLGDGPWLLRVDSSASPYVNSDRLEYFHDHFVGRPMAEGWSPPAFTVRAKSKKTRDFLAWENTAPLLSARARRVLEPLLAPHAEFLPFATFGRDDYFALNVTTVLDVLDLSRCVVRSYDGHITAMRRAFFRAPLPAPLSPIFKTPHWSDIYVTGAFVALAVEARLTGLILADPGADNFQLVIEKKTMNVVPGLAA